MCGKSFINGVKITFIVSFQSFIWGTGGIINQFKTKGRWVLIVSIILSKKFTTVIKL